jgi:hypothetical protein
LINFEAYPASVTGPVMLTWEHRNRLDDWSYADSGATTSTEPNCQYRVKTYDIYGYIIEELTTALATVTLVEDAGVVGIRVYGEVTSTGLLSHDHLFWQGTVIPTSGYLIDGYPESNANGVMSLGNSYWAFGQSFVAVPSAPDIDIILQRCAFLLRRSGLLTGNVVAKVYAHQGAWGSTGKPDGAALAVSDPIAATSIPSTTSLVSFVFTGANHITLTEGSYYVLTLEFTGGSLGNVLELSTDSSSPTHAGNYCSNYLGTWSTQSSRDACFYIYGDA